MEKFISKIRFAIRSHTLISGTAWKLWGKKKAARATDPRERDNITGRYLQNYRFDCRNPRSFNEWLCWLKNEYRNDLWKRSADKLGVKSFLEEIGLGDRCPKTYRVYDTPEEFNPDDIPADRFLLKTNSDSGTVMVYEKGKSDRDACIAKLRRGFDRSYADLGNEWVYDGAVTKVFAEELLLPEEEGGDLPDYKFFCFNGEPEFLFTAADRATDVHFELHNAADFSLVKGNYIHCLPKKGNLLKKPACYDEMLRLAREISSHFDFVRVDFYATTKGPMVGELTFFSQNGHGTFAPKKLDFEYGKLFEKTAFFEMAKSKKE